MYTLEQAVPLVTKKIPQFPETLVVLGSGWNKMIDGITKEIEIGYEEIFGVKATVPGHEGKLVIGTIKDKRIAFMVGRIHPYEGYSSFEATMPIRLFGKLGVTRLVLTAACGALNEKYKVGDFIVLSDVLTLFLALDNPLKGPQFVDVSEIFSVEMRQKAVAVAAEQGIPFHEGVYAYYHGPNYETPADKMALRFLGADVVGMSTVHEAIVARSLNMQTLGLSFVTNLAFVKHDHTEVVKEANKAAEKMKVLLSSFLMSFTVSKV